MTDLVACLSTGKGTWTNVLKLANRQDFVNIFLVVNPWTKENLKMTKQNVNLILINQDDKTEKIRDSIINQLKGKIMDLEVAVNMDSGTGKEHSAMITALMQLGLALRFVELDGDNLIELSQNQSFGFE